MIREHLKKALTTNASTTCRLAGASASAVFMWGIALLPANADAARIPHAPSATNLATDHSHNGNGRRNHNISSVRSPTHNRGYQHTSNSNAGGMTHVQNALCKNAKVCKISLKVIVVTPGKPSRTAPEKAEALTPEEVEAATPEKVDDFSPQKSDGLAPQTANAPPPDTRTFLYLGPYGFMLMAPASGEPTTSRPSMATDLSSLFLTNP
jgi:hypothetical protein